MYTIHKLWMEETLQFKKCVHICEATKGNSQFYIFSSAIYKFWLYV